MTWLLALGFLESIWDFVQENGAELAEGLKNTLKVSAIAMAGAFVVASSSAPHARTACP